MLGLKCHVGGGVYVPNDESLKVDYLNQLKMGGYHVDWEMTCRSTEQLGNFECAKVMWHCWSSGLLWH